MIANPYILKDTQARALFSNWAYRLILIIGSIYFLIILYLCIQKDFTILYTLASVLFIISFILYGKYGLYLLFRLIDGLNLDILKNNIFIELGDTMISLFNLTKQEFDELEKYFRDFNIEIEE